MNKCCENIFNHTKLRGNELWGCNVCGSIIKESGHLEAFVKTTEHQKEIKDKRDSINIRIKVD